MGSQVTDMIKAVDEDGNMEIEFEELIHMIEKNAGPAKGATGISFGAVFERKKNAKPVLWGSEKLGPGMKLENKDREVVFTPPAPDARARARIAPGCRGTAPSHVH